MSDWKIRFTKEHLQKAKEKGRTSFAVGFHGKDRGEAFMWLEDEVATALWLTAIGVNKGLPILKAAEEAESTIATWKAERDARAIGQGVPA